MGKKKDIDYHANAFCRLLLLTRMYVLNQLGSMGSVWRHLSELCHAMLLPMWPDIDSDSVETGKGFSSRAQHSPPDHVRKQTTDTVLCQQQHSKAS